MENNTHIYTEDQLMARLKFFIGICLSLTLFGIVFVVLYSLIFVTQPLNAISPIDQKFFELIVPIATFLTGTLSGIMLASSPESQQEALKAANKGWDKPPTPIVTSDSRSMTMPSTFGGFGGGGMGGSNSFGSMPLGGNQMSTTNSFAAPMPDFQPQVMTGFGGKPMPMQPPQPEL